MKKVIIFGLIVIYIGLIHAEPFYINTSTTQVGPGAIHRKYHAPLEPWMIDVLEIDLTNPYITVESIKACDRLGVRQPVRIQSENHSYEGHIALGAIKADFLFVTFKNSEIA
ncbi:MAG: hypothetical protein Q7J65_04400 [Candidatus Marinimicrobia bacterium]|nr:hypothetical protein [Candidatus Neomarinimicrobiota bacterium]